MRYWLNFLLNKKPFIIPHNLFIWLRLTSISPFFKCILYLVLLFKSIFFLLGFILESVGVFLDESGIGVLDKLLAALNKATTFESIDSSTEDTRFNLDSEKAKKLEKESIEI